MAEEQQQENQAKEQEQEAKKPGRLLPLLGVFFLSLALINLGMYFYFTKVLLPGRRAGLEDAAPEVEPAAELLPEDPPDSLRLAESAESDTLQEAVSELLDHMDRKNRDLDTLRDSTAVMLTRMDRLQEELDTMNRRQLELTSKDLDKLSRVFESMKPAKAAPVLMKMDNNSVATILLKINERNAAKILATMPAERAASITKLIRQRALEKTEQPEPKD